MSSQNLVTPNDLGPEFSVGGVTPNKITIITEDVTVYSEVYFARSVNGVAQSSSRNSTITRTAVGRWDIVFSVTHPDGVNYHPSVTSEEQSNFRDAPDITVVQGSQTANGFQVQLTTGDNGTSADSYVDSPWSFGVSSPVTFKAVL